MSVGGPTLAAALPRAGLIGEIHAFVQPAIFGVELPFLPTRDDRDDRIGPRPLKTVTFGTELERLRYATTGTAG